MSVATYRRDRETTRSVAGVRTNPGHWAAQQVHAFRTWTDDRALVTWCGLDADLANGAYQTTDLISCQTCAQASWLAFRGDR